MKLMLPAVGLITVLTTSPLLAQHDVRWVLPTTEQVASAKKYYLPAGTPVRLRTLHQISTKENKPGDRIYLEVAESVYFRGQSIIPAGAPVVGEVTVVQRNGHFGKKGKIGVRLVSLETPHGPVRISGDTYDEGRSGTAASVATMALVSPLGFLIHGTSGNIAPGSPVKALLRDNLAFLHVKPDTGDYGWVPATPDGLADATPGFGLLEK